MTGFRWTGNQVDRALGPLRLGGVLSVGNAGREADRTDAGLEISGVSTDTRKIEAGSLFVALAGEKYDGHHYLHEARARGAVAAVVHHRPADSPADLVYYTVNDTRRALARLGWYRRTRLNGRVVVVAGSNGKTTTKELLRAALSPRLRVHATDANLNNQIGVPLTLLAAPDDAEAVIVEAGTNEPGEIAVLSAIVSPDAAIVTSIGEEHLEGLGSVAGVLEEELAIFDALRPDGVGFVAEEPAELAERAAALIGRGRLRVAGFGEGAEARPDGGMEAVKVRPDGSTEWSFRGAPVHLPLPGMHNVRNALLALAVAAEWGVPVEDAARGLAAMSVPKMRSEWKRIGSLGVLADCYNANPPSTRAALDLLASVPAQGEKIAVLGTMKELGAHGQALHRELAEHALRLLGRGIDRVVATGDFVAGFAGVEGANGRVTAVADPIEAYAALRPALHGGETILLKGSRGVALERLIPLLERDFGGAAPTTTAGEG
ncbi:MAG TPA: UDP-N-acetylmuramoyl-tripeptide--D-alanyl-D-alanine ligase [Longimicrobium sp.]|nr:UDP-N-acetylmuramoyl-tripeptide--D-alanyl-D-alanine ligase [Longimicrobium sp.]